MLVLCQTLELFVKMHGVHLDYWCLTRRELTVFKGPLRLQHGSRTEEIVEVGCRASKADAERKSRSGGYESQGNV